MQYRMQYQINKKKEINQFSMQKSLNANHSKSQSPFINKKCIKQQQRKDIGKDYSREKMLLQKQKLQQFKERCETEMSYFQISEYPIKKPDQSLDIHFPKENTNSSNPYLRNFYLSILMQEKPPLNHSRLKIDMSKITFDQTEYHKIEPKYTVKVVNQNQIVQEETFENKSEYQQVINEIRNEYELPKSSIISSRTNTKVCLTPTAINKIRGSDILQEQQITQASQISQYSQLEQPIQLIKQYSLQSQKSNQSIQSPLSQKSHKSSAKSYQSLASQLSHKSYYSKKSAKSATNYYQNFQVNRNEDEQPQQLEILPEQEDSKIIQEQTIEHEIETPKIQPCESTTTNKLNINVLPPSPKHKDGSNTIKNKTVSKKFQEIHKKLYLIFGQAKKEQSCFDEPENDDFVERHYHKVSLPKKRKPRSRDISVL